VPEETLTLTLLTAFLGGAILLNVLDQELPARHEVHIAWFAASILVAAAVLTALAAAGERGAA
jgi:crotonobetainyl-CoA:carnitine CoA-transferase CaiB-like acyl-CoA transferase